MLKKKIFPIFTRLYCSSSIAHVFCLIPFLNGFILFKCFFHIDNLFCQIFFIALLLYPKCRASLSLFPTGFLSLFMLPFFSSTPLFTLCLCLFSTTSAERSPSKDKKQMGSKTIPFLVHYFVHGSMPFLGKQSNWHHSNPCGTGQGCYVAQATIPNCLSGCWANKIEFFCWSGWRSQYHGGSEHRLLPQQVRQWQKPHQASLHAITSQSHINPNLFCSQSHVR